MTLAERTEGLSTLVRKPEACSSPVRSALSSTNAFLRHFGHLDTLLAGQFLTRKVNWTRSSAIGHWGPGLPVDVPQFPIDSPPRQPATRGRPPARAGKHPQP